MKLKDIQIKNYRSIENETFSLEEVDGSSTYSLIGINESGKTSFLKAISLIDDGTVTYPKDFFDEAEPVDIVLVYELTDSDRKELNKDLSGKGLPKDLISKTKIEKVEIGVVFDAINPTTKENYESVFFKESIFPDYFFDGVNVVKKTESSTEPDFDLEAYFLKQFPSYFYKKTHVTTFWKSDPKHLISDQINLDAFAINPEDVSIPLFNCFNLAEIDDIPGEINKIRTDPARINNLQDKLGDRVTEHIKKVWPNHPVKIKFQINNMLLSFLIEDEKVKYKSKTTEQRSDGFRQFISFLLTISAENSINQLSNSLLLLDEPETHLHPRAQENLKDELIKITKNKENNIVIFATHSNYMIDKDNMDRSYRVTKHGNLKTKIEKIKSASSSYAEVNYEVFDIISSDYHNELYGYLEDVDRSKLDGIPQIKTWHNSRTGVTGPVSICTYIRHSIHHPENTLNPKYTQEELAESIKILRDLKYPPTVKKTAKKTAKKVAVSAPQTIASQTP